MEAVLEKHLKTIAEINHRGNSAEHNAQIGDNYKKLMTNSSRSSFSSPAPVRNQTYYGINAIRSAQQRIGQTTVQAPVQQRQNVHGSLTIEQALKNAQARQEQNQYYSPSYYSGVEYSGLQQPVQKQESVRSFVSAARSAADSDVLNSEAYAIAAIKKDLENRRKVQAAQKNTAYTAQPVEVQEQAETVQQAKAAVRNAQEAIEEAQRAKKTAQAATATSVEREYYVNLAKKAIAVFAVAFVILMSAIAVASTFLGTMKIELADLQTVLQNLQSQVETLRASIASEQSWESILAFIQANGLTLIA